MRKPSPIRAGDRVAFSARFLRDTLQRTGPKAFVRGTVEGFADGAPELAEILWDSGHRSHANVANLVHVQRLNAESCCVPAITTKLI